MTLILPRLRPPEPGLVCEVELAIPLARRMLYGLACVRRGELELELLDDARLRLDWLAAEAVKERPTIRDGRLAVELERRALRELLPGLDGDAMSVWRYRPPQASSLLPFDDDGAITEQAFVSGGGEAGGKSPFRGGSATWERPTSFRYANVVALGGGGGGGSGAKSNSVETSGGAAGGGGALSWGLFAFDDIAETVSVAVGAGGTGGASQTVNENNGNAGGNGGSSRFGSVSDVDSVYVVAPGGKGGAGGSRTVDVAGGNGGTLSVVSATGDGMGFQAGLGGAGLDGGDAEFGGAAGGGGVLGGDGAKGGSSLFAGPGGGAGGGVGTTTGVIVITNDLTYASAVAATSYTTTNLAAANNTNYYLAYMSRSAAAVPAPTITGAGLTWVLVTETNLNIGNRRVGLYRARVAAGATTAGVTINFGAGNTQTDIIAGIWHAAGVDGSGSNGSGSIAQSAANSAATGTTASATLAAFADAANNAALAVTFHTVVENIAPEAGYTETFEQQLAASGALELEWKIGQDTSPTSTFATTNNWAMLAVELKASRTFVAKFGLDGGDGQRYAAGGSDVSGISPTPLGVRPFAGGGGRGTNGALGNATAAYAGMRGGGGGGGGAGNGGDSGAGAAGGDGELLVATIY